MLESSNCLSLTVLFHLNLAFSSIEINQRPIVLEQCYWPILKLASELNIPLAIEATGYTLEVAAELDPKWLDQLRDLIAQGKCQFIGSGYAQIIGPIVPSEVNTANLYWGHKVYEKLLGIHPKIALVNEQAYSASLVSHYLKAGYEGIVMEWNNPYRYHNEWNSEWRYYPQYACGQNGEKIPVIWNNSIAFQKFQHYIYGELDRDEYINEYIKSHLGQKGRSFMLYGNDAEVFNFRPGRYGTETRLESDEWQRIYDLLKNLQEESQFKFISITDVLENLSSPFAGHNLSLESSEDPIPVKKQRKYNVTRWAVTGTDLEINSQCWSIYKTLKQQVSYVDPLWQELCYLWGSDFRTHITPKRFTEHQEQLRSLANRLGVVFAHPRLQTGNPDISLPPQLKTERLNQWLTLETEKIKIRLNCDRGLYIDRLWFKEVSPRWLCGSLRHGYYDDIDWVDHHFCGHLVFQPPGSPCIDDLQQVDPVIQFDPDEGKVWVTGRVNTPLGSIQKQVGIGIDVAQVDLGYELNFPENIMGYLRCGYVLLNPQAFDLKTLFFATHNGGEYLEKFPLNDKSFDHHKSVSAMVSSMCGLGVTEGRVILGDCYHQIEITIDKAEAALLGMVKAQLIGNSYFLQLGFSAREVDETAKQDLFDIIDPQKSLSVYRLSITAQAQSSILG
ncbi:hypothetical protein PMG71_08855 [Roseofilum sp. BLCC_M154]|uniref:Glycoside hydrolase family 57 N-terminal domain-containing protein n=1 Tax=Roseofilum acuticapitatum BLCC-M154 TaxID=3022444 RepID=A0ABT7ARJ5_9CYAN|nr:hypothetical protein [Roseofilum acuticapitatum]MDJ1169532.1 hypothetical protein [Roseofilum acuticapitatum BLCC-M154]